MAFSIADELGRRKPPGFSFIYTRRNEFLNQLYKDVQPTPMRTGTTSVGLIFSEGVILGSDTQNVSNAIKEKNAEKVHFLSKNIFCCSSGIAADCSWVCRLISSDLQLLELETKRPSRVATAVRLTKQLLFQYQGNLDVGLIIGGVDIIGSHLVTIYPHGSSDKLFYSGIGSGSMPSVSVLELKYKANMTKEEAKELLTDSISAGIYNDLNSGTSIDAVIITKDGPTQLVINIESKPENVSNKVVMNKDINILTSEIQRYKLETIDEKILR